MAKVIEFYIPKYFRKPHEWAPQLQLGKVIEFGSQTKKSAFLWPTAKSSVSSARTVREKAR